MTDRELLEYAAKAAGIVIVGWAGPDDREYPLVKEVGVWNPLTDDGDALRLAVKLNLLANPEFWHHRGVEYFSSACQGDRQDPYAATRRAIVRVAAEIGKAM